jgi:CRISPR-associated DxTHG motif protein
MSGMDKEKINKTTAYYDCKVLAKESGDYHNATDMLLKNYDNEFCFLGTQKAIDFQKKLLDYPEDKVTFLPIKDNSLDDIFEKVYELLSDAKGKGVVLDITHGFRHQPISAIFSATLHRFLNESSLQIIFAKQIVEHKEYEYILLNEYIDITQLSLLLTGFIRTLNFVDSVKIEGFETIAFSNFSKALLSNDFLSLENSYKNLLSTISRAKTDKRFDHLKELFETIENTLSIFDGFEAFPLYQKYLIIANLMYEKNYILLSLTYLFEAIRFYCSDAFDKNHITCKRHKYKDNTYNINQEVITFITQNLISNYQANCYDENYKTLYKNNIKTFSTIATKYKSLKELRNNLTHISTQKHSPDIKIKLKNQLDEIGDLIKDDILHTIDTNTNTPKKEVKNFFKKG